MPAMMQPKKRGRPRMYLNEKCLACGKRPYVPHRGSYGRCNACTQKDAPTPDTPKRKQS